MPIVFSATASANGSFDGIIPPRLIHQTLDTGVLSTVAQCQTRQWSRGSGTEVVIVLDDVAYDTAMRSSIMRELFMNGRHLHVTILLTCQYGYSVPPSLRANVDVVFACKDYNVNSKRKLWSSYFGMYGTFAAFNDAFERCTQNYETLVYSSMGGDSCVFWYKADPKLRPRVGDAVFWKMKAPAESR